MNNSPLLALLRAVPRPAAIIDRRGAILDINASFRALCGPPRLPDAAAAYSDGAHSERLRRVLGLDRPGWRGAEITLLLHGKPRLCWCEVHSLTIEGQLLHFLELHDMEQLRALEAAFPHRVASSFVVYLLCIPHYLCRVEQVFFLGTGGPQHVQYACRM